MNVWAAVVALWLAAGQPVPAVDDGGTLRVVVWNIQRAGAAFDRGPEKARDLLASLRPDICLLQESYDIEGERPTLGRWIGDELGWHAHQGESPHLCVLSRVPAAATFFHHGWHGVGVRVADDQGRTLVAYSVWLDSSAYTPYALRDHPDATDAELLACESERSGRLKQARGLLEHLRSLGQLDAEEPVLVGGDWNCPSHLDWTAETAKVFRFRRALALPVSGAMHDAGFEDTYRSVHPEPVQAPGITWSPLYRGTPEKPETADRIDRLYVKHAAGAPRLRAVRAWTLPVRWEEPGTPEKDRVFPSDHCALVVDFVWEHAGAPAR